MLPLAWSMDHVGPMTRTARDSALMLGAIAGYDPADPTTSVLPVPDYTTALTGDVKGVRVGLLRAEPSAHARRADSEQAGYFPYRHAL